jgi:phosphatidylglycerol lysyltransferase
MQEKSPVLVKYLKRYGSLSTSYTTIQDGFAHYLLDGAGYIPYALTGRGGRGGSTAYCLSNPIAAPEDYERLLAAFLKRFPRAAFIQVTEGFAQVLERAGFLVNEMGVETEIFLREFKFSGRARESQRRSIRKAMAAGTKVEELTDPSSAADELMEISSEWLKTKTVKDRELRFVARGAVFEREPDVRKFAARINGRHIGFVFFSPMYDDGRVYGYLADVLRTRPDAPSGTITLILKHAIDLFKAEGREVLSLGLSPFFDIADDRFRHSLIMKHAFKTLYRAGNGIFPFKNLSYTKSRYGGGLSGGSYRDPFVGKKKVYFAHTSRFPLKVLYESSKISGLIEGAWPALKKTLAGV